MKTKTTEHAERRYCQRVLGVTNPKAEDYRLARESILREWSLATLINQHGQKIKKQFHDTVYVLDRETRKLTTAELYS